jgi:hypothetical protein
VFERDGTLLQVALWSSHVNVTVAAPDSATAKQVVAELRESFPLPDPSATHEVPITPCARSRGSGASGASSTTSSTPTHSSASTPTT